VYTDGACLGNPGPGGWAWAVPDGPYAAGPEAHTTNQRMELQALLEAVRALEGPLDVVTDSTYVANCFRDRWWEGWVRNGWRNKAKQPVANRDLWEPLIDAHQAGRFGVPRWVKGHSGDAMNDLVDRLAVEAATTQQPRQGTGTPTDLGAADAPARSAARRVADERAAPDGRRLVVAGHRPPQLGGYDANPIADGVRARLGDILRAKAEMHPDLVVLSGLGLGAEQLGAEAAREAGVPYVAVLPFPEADAAWPEASRRRFRALADGASDTVVLQSNKPATKQAAGGALARRDAWLARNANEAIVVWDGKDDLVGRLVRSLRDHVGEDDVWVVDPAEI
jgi:ribonuclease HI